MTCGELASRTFFISPEEPKIGVLHRMRELDVTVPKPRRQRVPMSLLRSIRFQNESRGDRTHDVVVLPIAKRSETESAIQAAAQLDGRQKDVVNNGLCQAYTEFENTKRRSPTASNRKYRFKVHLLGSSVGQCPFLKSSLLAIQIPTVFGSGCSSIPLSASPRVTKVGSRNFQRVMTIQRSFVKLQHKTTIRIGTANWSRHRSSTASLRQYSTG